jgi:hypothetical protein
MWIAFAKADFEEKKAESPCKTSPKCYLINSNQGDDRQA